MAARRSSASDGSSSGSLVGGFLAHVLGFAWAGWISSLVVSTVGAILLLIPYWSLRGIVRPMPGFNGY